MSTATATRRKGAVVDFIAVERRLAGDTTVELTEAEQIVAIHAARNAGLSKARIGALVGVGEHTVTRRLADSPPLADYRLGSLNIGLEVA